MKDDMTTRTETIAIGFEAGALLQIGERCIFIGDGAGKTITNLPPLTFCLRVFGKDFQTEMTQEEYDVVSRLLKRAIGQPVQPCKYPACVDNGPEGKCIDWLTGVCPGPSK